MSTGGMPRPRTGSVGTSVGSSLKTKMPSMKGGNAAKGVILKGVTMPKVSAALKGGVKLSSKTKSGGAVKAPKSSVKASSLSSALKGIISKAKKLPAMGMSSSIGAPAATPSPAFFGSPNPSAGKPGLGM